MGIKSPQNSLVKPVGMALGVAAIAAIATMFVPVAMLESVTGSTGISEMIPATAAPLGDTARAIMAFVVGAVTLTIAMILLLLPEKRASKAPPAEQPVSDPYADEPKVSDRLAGLKARAASLSMPKLALPKMPWVKSEDDILDLADLPKLRAFDAHPDAPARRPLSASSDLAEPMALAMQPATQAPVASAVEIDEVAAAEEQVKAHVAAEDVVASSMAMPDVTEASLEDISLSDMVAQLEAAVIQRKAQLAELEIVAAKLSANNGQADVMEEAANVPAKSETTEILPPEPPRPVLEAVPSSPRLQTGNAGAEEMDAALSAALETLQRMNAQAR
jgi:hypothetical protein